MYEISGKLSRSLFRKVSHLIEEHSEGEPVQFCQYGINLCAKEASLFIFILLMRDWFGGFFLKGVECNLYVMHFDSKIQRLGSWT